MNRATWFGTILIKPVIGEPFIKTGEWLYSGQNGCWYHMDEGASYPEEICELVAE